MDEQETKLHAVRSQLAAEGVLEAVGRNEEGALEALYDRYARLAFSLAYTMLGEREAAEDVIQESFLNAWRRARTYNPHRGSERSWFMSIVRNCCIDKLRSHSVRPQSAGSDAIVDTPARNDVWLDVSNTLTAEEISSALSNLAPDQRETIELAYYRGLTQQEISAQMGVPLGTVKGRIRMGLQRLRRLLLDREADLLS